MRRILTTLALPLIVLVAVVAFDERVRGVAAAGPPEVQEHAATAAPSDATATVHAAPAPGASVPDPETEAESRARRVAERAEALLASLRSWASAELAALPMMEIEEVSDLLTRHPEAADLFIAALGEEGCRLRTYLVLAFYKVTDEALRKHLIEAHRTSIGVNDRLGEILSDRTLVLATLREPTAAQLKADLVNRMGPGLLDDDDVYTELVRIVEEDLDERTRCRAIRRLGKVDRPDARELLLRILTDPVADVGDRRAAASQLGRSPCPEAVKAFVAVLEAREHSTLMRFAASGLKRSANEPAARESLLSILGDERCDLQARKNAASTLAHWFRSLKGSDRDTLETDMRRTLTDLTDKVGSGALAVHSMGELSQTLGSGYQAELKSFFNTRASKELRQQMLAHPLLKRFLENE